MLKIVKVDLGINLLDYIVEYLKDAKGRTALISANRRPIRFIENRLTPEGTLKVDFFTIDEFASNVVLKFTSPPPVFHKKLERDLFFLNLLDGYLVKVNNFLKIASKSDLYPWARKLSQLFDEVDRQLLGERLQNYQYVEGVKEAEVILQNLKELYELYEREYREYTYSGKNLKLTSQITQTEQFRDSLKESNFIYMGFVYLSNAEYEIVKNLSKVSNCTFFIQTDLIGREEYFNTFKVVEKTIEKLKEAIKTPVHIEEIEAKSAKITDFELFEFNGLQDEVRYAAHKIEELFKEYRDRENPANLAVILPQNFAIVPLLSFLGSSEEDIPINITMSYPLSSTDIGIFLSSLFELLLELENNKINTGKYCSNASTFLRFLNSSLISFFKNEIKQEASLLKDEILTKQLGTFCLENLNVGLSALVGELINPFLNILNPRDAEGAFYSIYKSIDKDKLKSDRLLTQTIQYFFKEIMDTLDNSKLEFYLDLRLLNEIVKQVMSDIYLPFEGHPLRGVQIMGMLESRTLSFDTVIFLDVNEGVLPSPERIDPLMPEDIKKSLGLSSYKEKEELMRYNFFRLAYSSKRCLVFYKASSSINEKNLRSRFVEQIILNLEIKGKEVKLNSKTNLILPDIMRENGIVKDDFIRQKLNPLIDSKLAPAALDTYISCPYRFYLKYVKEIPEKPGFEDNLEANRIGTLVHLILKKGFEGFTNRLIDKKTMDKIREITLRLTDNIKDSAFTFGNEDVDTFLLSLKGFRREALWEVVRFRLESFFAKNRWFEFRLVGVEKELSDRDLKVKGIIDRVDQENGKVRILDYKTGKHAQLPKTLVLKEMFGTDEISGYTEKELEKIKENVRSIQLPVYLCLISNKVHCPKYEAFLCFLGKEDEIFKGFEIDDVAIEEIKKLIRYVVNHIRKSTMFYAITGPHCQYCEYFDLCRYSKI